MILHWLTRWAKRRQHRAALVALCEARIWLVRYGFSDIADRLTEPVNEIAAQAVSEGWKVVTVINGADGKPELVVTTGE
jgi:hypothetical protein